jgi:hypothetical protein
MIFRKVKKTQHPNLKFGHTWGEIPKKTLTLKGKGEIQKPSIFVVDLILSCFFFPKRLHCCYIYFHYF